jgi:hypothetical protein
MPTNRIDASFTSEQREKAKAALASLAESLPFLIDLGADERTTMLKFGEKNRSFVVKALAIAEAQPEMLPQQLPSRRIPYRRGARREPLSASPRHRNPVAPGGRHLFRCR